MSNLEALQEYIAIYLLVVVTVMSQVALAVPIYYLLLWMGCIKPVATIITVLLLGVNFMFCAGLRPECKKR